MIRLEPAPEPKAGLHCRLQHFSPEYLNGAPAKILKVGITGLLVKVPGEKKTRFIKPEQFRMLSHGERVKEKIRLDLPGIVPE